MNNVHPFPQRNDARSEEAGLWLARLADGLSPEQEQELAAWLGQSKANYNEFMELAKLWDKMDGLSRLAAIFPEPTTRKPAAGSHTGLAVAATVLLGVALVSWFGIARLGEHTAATETALATAPAVYQTSIGEQSTHTLADGSTIVLNTNSLVSVAYSSSNRLITLSRGELHIKVAHDPARPLSVIIGDKIVQAVGTEFNIEISSDESIELVVTDGLVMVGVMRAPAASAGSDAPIVLARESKIVAAGQEVTISADDEDLAAVEAEEIESESISVKLSWREGNLIFRGESLEEAVAEVGRYTAVEFVFLDDEAKKVRVAGLFKAGDVDGLLAALRTHFNISYEWQGDNKIVLSTE